MAGSLGLGIALLIIGLLGLLFFPWGGIIVAIVGLLLILAFVLGFGRRATQPRPRP
jgi:membrane protein implicated in regulation of membrane protease activity